MVPQSTQTFKKKSCLVSTKKSPGEASEKTTGSEPNYHVISVRDFWGLGLGGKRNSGISTIVFENLIFIGVLTMEASVLLGY